MALDFAAEEAERSAFRSHLRDAESGEHRVTFVELFFDLVYVFAITQLAHHLIDHLDAEGALKTAFLLMVVWWAWIYTTWMTNWFDPGSVHVRLVLLGCMLASLLMAAALPHAFDRDGALFGCAYAALQVGRNLAGAILLHASQKLRRDFERMLAWSALSGVLWVVGGLVDEEDRALIWVAALALDFLAPLVLYWVPGRGRTRTEELPVEGGHFAERFQLFVIIALGESIVITGATASEAGTSGSTFVALAVAFASTAALWWLYFEEVAANSQKVIREHDDPGRLARDAYSYMHIPIVAGIIASAVGAEILILHPNDHPHVEELAVLVGGPVLYLVGESLFRWRMARKFSRARLLTVAALAAVLIPGTSLSVLTVASVLTGILVLLAVVEFRAKAV